ncbi:TonB-dependent receptor, partial [Parabacteroides sp. OttesenSCG-928-G06]|nr:TonB-dependent receptor [Parabacteroides sp. OttesenSCG-928-G06]
MKTTNYIKAICAAALLLVSLGAAAQEETNLTREMTLEREYDPTVQDANKVNSLPKVKEPEIRKIPIDYAATTIPGFPSKEVTLLPSGNIATDMEYNKRRGYLNLGVGNYTNINGDLGYHILSTPKDQLNIFFTHRSSNGNIKYVQDWLEDEKVKAKLNDNLGGINFRHVFDRHTLTLGGHYQYTGFNYHGIYPSSTVTGKWIGDMLSSTWDENSHPFGDRETNQVHQSFGARIGLGTNPGATDLGYKVDLSYTNFSQKYAYLKAIDGVTEHSVQGTVDIFAPVATSQQLGVRANMNYFLYSSPIDSAYNNYLVGTINPYYRVEGSNWNLLLGANILFNTGDFDRLRVSPNIAANVEIADKTVFYLKAGGGVRNNSLNELSRVNRYANPWSTGPKTYELLDALVGFKSGVAPGFWFDVFGGYQITDYNCFFIPTLYNPERDFSQAMTLFMPDSKRFLFGASLKYAYQNMFEVNLKGVYSNWKVTTEDADGNEVEHKPYGAPGFEFTANFMLRPIEKVSLALDYNLQTGRYIGPSFGEEKMKNLNDLNFTGTYSINDTFGLYVKLNN